MSYTKLFNPPPPDQIPDATEVALDARGDRRDGLGYVYPDDVVLKVNVALATGRPLLVRGPSGAGKSSLAGNVARLLKWRYYEYVVTSRTHARDLLYTFDTLRRLSDAELGRLSDERSAGKPLVDLTELALYIEPGVLWWAIDQDSARRRGAPAELPGVPPAKDLNRNPDAQFESAVVLIDEIDKADPDVPNDLLVPFGSLEFRVDEIGVEIKSQQRTPPLIIITTNNERELPNAFMRRCLILDLQRANRQMLINIAAKRFGQQHAELYTALADLMDVRPEGKTFGQTPLPSTAEYIDAIHACRGLFIKPDRTDPVWRQIEEATLWKPRDGGGT